MKVIADRYGTALREHRSPAVAIHVTDKKRNDGVHVLAQLGSHLTKLNGLCALQLPHHRERASLYLKCAVPGLIQSSKVRPLASDRSPKGHDVIPESTQVVRQQAALSNRIIDTADSTHDSPLRRGTGRLRETAHVTLQASL